MDRHRLRPSHGPRTLRRKDHVHNKQIRALHSRAHPNHYVDNCQQYLAKHVNGYRPREHWGQVPRGLTNHPFDRVLWPLAAGPVSFGNYGSALARYRGNGRRERLRSGVGNVPLMTFRMG